MILCFVCTGRELHAAYAEMMKRGIEPLYVPYDETDDPVPMSELYTEYIKYFREGYVHMVSNPSPCKAYKAAHNYYFDRSDHTLIFDSEEDAMMALMLMPAGVSRL